MTEPTLPESVIVPVSEPMHMLVGPLIEPPTEFGETETASTRESDVPHELDADTDTSPEAVPKSTSIVFVPEPETIEASEGTVQL